jgi:hypothetical protein
MAHGFLLLYVAFSPDNRRLLTCSFDFSARVWDARTGQPLGPPLRHGQRVSWGAFSPDGKTVVTASWDRSARIWDVETAKPLTEPLPHHATVSGAFWSADGRRLNTLTEDGRLQVWDVASGEPLTPPRKVQEQAGASTAPETQTWAQSSEAPPRDDRPVADLVLLAQMLAVGQIDRNGSVVPLQLRDLTSAWALLQEKYASQFAAKPAEIVGWHRRQAQESLVEGNLSAASFHLDHASKLSSQDLALARQRAGLEAVLSQATNKPSNHVQPLLPIPPRDPRSSAEQIDLSSHYNQGLRDGLSKNSDGNNLAALPEGLITFGGVRFDVRGLIHLEGQVKGREESAFPVCANGIRVARKCRRLHFLQATASSTTDGAQVGSYVLHFADGQRLELPVVYGQDLRKWWFSGAPKTPLKPNGALVVWTGSNRRAAEEDNAGICLYKSTRENPVPDAELISIDFVSCRSNAAPFLVALTVE